MPTIRMEKFPSVVVFQSCSMSPGMDSLLDVNFKMRAAYHIYSSLLYAVSIEPNSRNYIVVLNNELTLTAGTT